MVEMLNNSEQPYSGNIYQVWDSNVCDVGNFDNETALFPKYYVYTPKLYWSSSIFHDLDVHFLSPRKALKPGRKIKISYRKSYSDLFLVPLLLIFDQERTELHTFEFDHTVQDRIEVEVYSPNLEVDYEFEQIRPGKSVLTIGPYSTPPDLPYLLDHSNATQLLVKVFRNDSLITCNTPENMVKWFQERVSFEQELEQIPAELAAVITPELPDREKLRLINSYIQDNIRYISESRDDHSWVPFTADEIITLQYGDCKDRAFLFKALARHFGIQVEVALISNEPYPDFPEDSMHLMCFDHVIGYWDNNGQPVFFDPTSYHAFGELNDQLEDKRVLVLDLYVFKTFRTIRYV
jgi:hypothetical protein